MKVGETYINNMTKEKFKILRVFDWGSAEAVSVENNWDVIGIRQSDLDNRVFDLFEVLPVGRAGECLDHSYIL
jgi:hypothetical protein